MPRNVSFYGQSDLMQPIQREYAQDPRTLMAQQLMAQSAKGPRNASDYSGIAHVLRSGLGGYQTKQLAEEKAGREGQLKEDMATVLSGGETQPWVNPGTEPGYTPTQPPPGSLPASPVGMPSDAPAGGRAGMQAALGGIDNPDINPLRQQMMMQQIQQQEATAAAELARTQGMEDYEKKLKLKQLYPTPTKLADPYSTPIKTSEGWISFDNRSGTWKPIESPAGGTALPIAADPILAGEMSESKASGGEIGKKNADQFFAVKHAFDQREDIAKLVDHLKTSTAITGFGAEMFKNIERAKAMLGSKVADGTASDTEILDVMMGKEVFPMIKALGVGARGMDTPAEREFMRSVLTGSISLNKTTLLRMAEIRSDVAERTINNWNERMDAGELDRFYKNQDLPKTRFELNGASTQPTTQTATPEDQAALEWATANPADPRAAEIRKRLGQ